jgi:hypothetical protein
MGFREGKKDDIFKLILLLEIDTFSCFLSLQALQIYSTNVTCLSY